LVVDEPDEWIDRVAQRLRRMCIVMRVATSGQESLQIVGTERVDLAFIASDLPQLGGLRLVRQVHEIVDDLPVVLIDSRSDRHWLEEALRLKARTILPRPVDTTLAVETIRRMLDIQGDWCGWPGYGGPVDV